MRDLIKLVSSAKTGHFYTTTKNKRGKTEKLELKKYDPVVRKHVPYKESKISQSQYFACEKGRQDLDDLGALFYCVHLYPFVKVFSA